MAQYYRFLNRLGQLAISGKFFTFILLSVLLAVAGCTGSGGIDVDLDERDVNTPPIRQVQDISGDNTLKVAISAVISPAETLKTYQKLLDYLEQETGREIILLQRPTYAEVNDLLEASEVDLAFICSLAYVAGNNDFGMELLVAPQVNEETVYYSYLVVPADSSALSLEDLRNTVFAFTDPLSNSGRLAPTYQLSLIGETPDSFFSRYDYTFSHDNSILAVADGLVSGAAIDSLVYDQSIESNPELESKTKVIGDSWGPYGIPPVVINPDLDPQLKSQLLDAFLDLPSSGEGRQILDELSIEKFVQVDDEIYDSIRQMLLQLEW